MEPYSAASQTVQAAPRSGYDYVGSQIAALIARFDLNESRAQIMQTYADLCRDSLAFPYGVRPPNYSRINHDGTPIQYAVTLGSSVHTLQFLGEAGSFGITGAERMRLNRECIAIVAGRLHVDKALVSVADLLEALAPATNVDLLADPGGAYWIGAAFSAAREPHLRIYVNTRWGNERARWTRLSRFAGHFGESAPWAEVAGRLALDMQPLGTAITLQGDQSPVGRIYLSAYGKHMPFYEDLAEAYGGPGFMRQLRSFGRCLLGADYVYPTQTAVCSFGFGDNPTLDFKFELCAHCLFRSDAEAVARLRTWFDAAQLDATDYWAMLDILSEGHLCTTAPVLHCYVGMGLRRGAPYATLYLKPQLMPA
ncbi:MAG TPA: hypothetical protein VGK81_02015 [Anaerolineae bacterium]